MGESYTRYKKRKTLTDKNLLAVLNEKNMLLFSFPDKPEYTIGDTDNTGYDNAQ